jgi:uncharacterized protein (DUF433 family)
MGQGGEVRGHQAEVIVYPVFHNFPIREHQLSSGASFVGANIMRSSATRTSAEADLVSSSCYCVNLGSCTGALAFMTTQSLDRHVVSTPDTLGGKARIAGRRISVEDIAIWYVRLGKTVDEICAEYDLSLAEVHAALAHYYDHQAEIERDINEGDAFVKALRNSTPSKLAKRLAERRGE